MTVGRTCCIRAVATLSLLATMTVSWASRAADAVYPKAYTEGSLGIGLLAGKHAYSVTFAGGKYFEKETVTGPLLNAAFTVGVAWTNVALGFAVDGTYSKSLWRSDEAKATVWAGSAALLWRSGATGMQGALFLGYAAAKATAEEPDYLDAVYASTHDDWMGGPRVALRVGYMWPSGFGFSTTGSYAYLVAADSKYLPVAIAFNGFLAGW